MRRRQVTTIEAGIEPISSDRPSLQAFELAKPEDPAREEVQENSGEDEQAKSETVGSSLVLLFLLAAGTIWAWIFMRFVMLLNQCLSLLLLRVLLLHP